MNHDILFYIEICTAYAVKNGLCGKADEDFVRNRLLELFHLDAPSEEKVSQDELPEYIAETFSLMTDYAAQIGLFEPNTPVFREIFENRIGACMLMWPSAAEAEFGRLYREQGPRAATDWFYALCRKSNYIRTREIARNLIFCESTPYGEAEVTINLTKPEKDPQEIARQLAAPQTNYPKCQLCKENAGYAGRINHPARQLLRTIPLTLNGEAWRMQYSPYVYFNEHCIALSDSHTPMDICRATYVRLFDFLDQFPHYFIGSNAGLPIAGGSILSHLHFQGGRHTLPMMKAPVLRRFSCRNSEVTASQLKWPMPVLRLESQNREALTDLAERVTLAWEQYSDASQGIYAHTDGTAHNTITPISQKKEDKYILDLVFRNNLTSEEFPLGIFHPHPCRHHIKRENIGLIEVMGLFILPGRLKNELAQTVSYLCGQEHDAAAVEPHKKWADEIRARRSFHSPQEAQAVLRNELAQLCMQLLGDAAVFKDTPEGNEAFARFIDCCAL